MREECLERLALRWHLKRSSNFLEDFVVCFGAFVEDMSDSLSDSSKDQAMVGKGAKAAESRATVCLNKLFMLKSSFAETRQAEARMGCLYSRRASVAGERMMEVVRVFLHMMVVSAVCFCTRIDFMKNSEVATQKGSCSGGARQDIMWYHTVLPSKPWTPPFSRT